MRRLLWAVPAALALAGCPATEDTFYACSYEESKTDGCDGAGYGPWTAGCFSFDSEDYVISPGEVCDNITEEGLFCEAGCCINYAYRNVVLRNGDCP